MIKRNDLNGGLDTMRTLVPNDHRHEPARRRVARRYPHALLRQPPADDSGRAGSEQLLAKQYAQQELQIEPRPDEIARFRFSRRLFGVHPGEVQRALLEIAATLDRSQVALAREILERRALEKSLEKASATIQELQQQLIAARAELSAGQDRERALARELQASREARPEFRPVTAARAEETVVIARQAANAIMETARAAALEVLRSARAAAHAIRRSAEVVVVIDGRPVEGRISDLSNRGAIMLQRTARTAPR